MPRQSIVETCLTDEQRGRLLSGETLAADMAQEVGDPSLRKALQRWRDRWRQDQDQAQANTTGRPVVRGSTARDAMPDADAVWARVIARQERRELERRELEHVITLPDEPACLVALSDIHVGNPQTDYRRARRDAEIIRGTPGMYALVHGDLLDNWIAGKLLGQQRHQVVTLDEEWALVRGWLDILDLKLLLVVAGNHDNWTHKIAGIDFLQHLLRNTMCLYDRNEILVALRMEDVAWRILVRHKYPGSSVYNPTHGMVATAQRGDHVFDVAIGGHTHRGTYINKYHQHGREWYAVLTGTYKTRDEYGTELGVAGSKDSGSAALLLLPTGQVFPLYDLAFAAYVLGQARRDWHDLQQRLERSDAT